MTSMADFSKYGGVGFDPSYMALDYGKVVDGSFVGTDAGATHVRVRVRVLTVQAMEYPVWVSVYRFALDTNSGYSGIVAKAPLQEVRIAASASPISQVTSFIVETPLPGTVAVGINTISNLDYHCKASQDNNWNGWAECNVDELAWPINTAEPLVSTNPTFTAIEFGGRCASNKRNSVILADDWVFDAEMNQYSGLLQPFYDAIYPVGYTVWYPVTENTDAKRTAVLDAFVAKMSKSVTHTRAGITSTVLSSTWTYDIDTYVLGTGSFQSRRLYAITRTD